MNNVKPVTMRYRVGLSTDGLGTTYYDIIDCAAPGRLVVARHTDRAAACQQARLMNEAESNPFARS